MRPMNALKTTRRKVAAVAVSAVVVAGGTAAGALFATGGSAAAAPGHSLTAAVTTARPRTHHHHPWLRGALGELRTTDHATFEVKRHGSWVTLTFDRGKLTSASASQIVVARPDGQSATIALTPTTRYRGAASEVALVRNRPVAVVSQGGRALIVLQPRAGAHRPGTRKPAAPKPAPATKASAA
jgi:hypothetical protein